MTSGTLINIIIIFAVFLAIFRGWTIGLVRQFFSAGGFILGLFLGVFLEKYFVKYGHTPQSRTIITLICTLGLAFIFLILGEILGNYLKRHIHFKQLNYADSFLGSIISIFTTLISIWLAAIILSSTSISGVQSFLNSSSILRALNSHLPNAPTVVADLGSIIDPNGFPKVFLGNEPVPNNSFTLPSLSKFQSAINKDQASIVKIEGLGCGGMVEGSGFIVKSDYVATNAHVIAGVHQIYVVNQTGSHPAVPVYFDPNLDFAVLEVKGLNGSPLKIDTNILSNGSSAIIAGYPGGGPLNIKPAVIMDDLNAVGLNIYGQGHTERQVYELKADVIPGNSGGPVIEQNGDVFGVVFAQSTTYNQVGYALTANQITGPIAQAENSNNSVSTRSCAE